MREPVGKGDAYDSLLLLDKVLWQKILNRRLVLEKTALFGTM